MDDSIKYVVHQLDGSGDIISIPRTFMKGCAMRKDKFAELFYEFAKDHNQVIAYEKAEEFHERLFGRPRYSDYDSFRMVLTRK